MASIVSNCTCNSEFQDKQYGKGRRLFNLSEKGNEAKCTVCGSKKRVRNGE